MEQDSLIKVQVGSTRLVFMVGQSLVAKTYG